MIKYLKPEGTFIYFGMVTVTGSLFFKYIVKETSGLTDKQKKQLYFPDEFKDDIDSGIKTSKVQHEFQALESSTDTERSSTNN